MDLLTILARAELEAGTDKKRFLAGICLHLFQEYPSLLLIEEQKNIQDSLSSFLTNDTTNPQLYSKKKLIEKRESPEILRTYILNLGRKQQKILSCPLIDEHVLLLACLKGLQNIFPTYYKIVLKEILTKQLHRMEQTDHTTHIIGRKKELETMQTILHRSVKNSILLIGPSGIGKTTLAQAAQQLFPEKKLMRLFPETDIFFDQVISILSNSEKQIIFFLDELPTFAMNHLQYLLENSQIIATANESAYKKLAADYPHITNKFEVIPLEEPNEEDLIHMVTDKLTELQKFYTTTWEEGIIDETILLGKRYIQEPAFPAKALQLAEEAALTAQQQHLTYISKEFIRILISQKTHIPIGSLTELEKKDLANLPQKLQERVKGQDEAIKKISGTIQRARLGFKKANKPVGSFLFVGPSGVGKTELAKALAKEVFGDEDAMIRLDMSEFAEAHMVQRLIGSPPGYIGYEEGGQLTNPVKAKPYSLILLDEIEKAHPRVFDIFLQVLDDGHLTDGQGKQVDFKNTIIIATSNAGIEDMVDMIQEGKTHAEIEKEIKDILSDYFRMEFINRFDGIVIFDPLSINALSDIARLQINKLQNELEKRGISLTVSDTTRQALAQEAYDPRYGARGLLRLLQDTIENKLAEMIIHGELTEGQTVAF